MTDDGTVTEADPPSVSYVVEHYGDGPDFVPVLLRTVRSENGATREQAWSPGEERWVESFQQYEAWLGKNDHDFEEIDEQRARAIQQAHRQRLARLDERNLTTD